MNRSTALVLVAAVFLFAGRCRGPEKAPAPAVEEAPPPAAEAAADVRLDWPQWRGPGGRGRTFETGLPEVWSLDSPNVVWKADVPGVGNSSPIVGAGRVFLTTAVPLGGAEEMERRALAYDLADGKLLWQTVVWTAPPEQRHRLNTSAAPTPATDGEHVFVHFGPFLAALDLDGRVAWKKEVEPEANYLATSRYAAVSSPVVHGDVVVLVQDQESGKDEDVGWAAAFDKATGEERWRHTWDETCCSYSTPLFISGHEDVAARLFFAHSGALTEYEPATGEVLFQQAVRINQMVASLVWEDNVLCVAGGAHNVRNVYCMRLRAPRDEVPVEVLWEDNQGAPETASPVLVDGRLYTVTERGILWCRDAFTGESLWRRRLTRGKGSYSVSLLAGDGKLYVTSAGGLTTVFALEEEGPRQVAENDVGEGVNASLAVTRGRFVQRTKNQLLLIEREQGRRAVAP